MSAVISTGGGARVAHQGDAGLVELELHQVAAGLDQGREVEGLRGVVEMAALDPRHVEERVDDFEEVLAGIAG